MAGRTGERRPKFLSAPAKCQKKNGKNIKKMEMVNYVLTYNRYPSDVYFSDDENRPDKEPSVMKVAISRFCSTNVHRS